MIYYNYEDSSRNFRLHSDVASAYPLRDIQTYEGLLQDVERFEEEVSKKVGAWEKQNLIDSSILEKIIEKYKTIAVSPKVKIVSTGENFYNLTKYSL